MRPKLTRSFEPALALAAGRFDRPAADWPTPTGDFLVVHPRGLSGEVVLLFAHGFAGLTSEAPERSDLSQDGLLLPVPQLVQPGLDPVFGFNLIGLLNGAPQRPQMFPTMIKIQKRARLGPAIRFQVPNPTASVRQDQRLFGPSSFRAIPHGPF